MAEVELRVDVLFLMYITTLKASLCLMSAEAILPQDDKSDLLREHRQKELKLRRETYRQVLSTRAVCVFTLHLD